jgi:hypothetical protein
MTHFADVEQFVREHATCGGITPSAAAQPGGGFMLSLVCGCGRTFDRWVTVDEARQPLPALPRPPVPGAGGGAPPAELSSRSGPPSTPAEDFDALMREALAAEDEVTIELPPAAPPPMAASSGRPPLARLDLDSTIQTALTEHVAMRTAASGPARSATRGIWLAVFAVLALGAAAGLYLAVQSQTPVEPPSASAAATPATPTAVQREQRAALDEVLRSLRELQAISAPSTALSVYSSRVLFARTDVERFLAAAPAGPDRTAVREVLDVHLLAAAAWKARTLEQKELWEPVAQDPAIELCASVKGVVDFAVLPENVPRAQARGAAVASTIPLLWECAAEKIAALDRRLSPAPGAPAARR